MNGTDSFRAVRDRQITWGLGALSILGLLPLLVSLFGSPTRGYRNTALYTGLYIIVLFTALLSNRLPLIIRATVLIGVPLVLGITGLFTWGLPWGLPALLTFCILVTMFSGKRTGILAAGLTIMIILIAGILFRSGILQLPFDPRIYLTSYVAWIAALTGIAISAGLIVIALGNAYSEIETLIHVLETRNADMATVIMKLEREVSQRTSVEQEKQKLEGRLQHAQHMESLGTLAAGVAHDLNNVLVGSVSYPDLLLASLPGDSPLRRSIEIIKRSGIKAAAMVNDLLTLARRGVGVPKVVDLNEVISEYLASPEYQKLESFHPNVELKVELGRDVPNILGSSFHLSKVIMNLVSNAAEAMPAGGLITVQTGRQKVAARMGTFEEIMEGDYFVLSVTDTGIGISEEDITKIFEPFYTKKVMGRSGTGLGMAVVWGTVKDHKGYVDVESTEGKGTTFTLLFPATDERPEETPDHTSVKEYLGQGESILIVDDVPDQREIAAKMLSQLGYTVNTAASGEEAIALLEKFQADLLVLDMYMDPGIDGLETYQRILSVRPEQKAIIISGYSETRQIRKAQELGAGVYVKKPFFLQDIGIAVRAELNRPRPVGPTGGHSL
jgi:signal transduction histidine kinase/CheY-like chemotaxis protein